MLNWRKYALPVISWLCGRKIFNRLNYYQMMEHQNPEHIERESQRMLSEIILHAYKNVPYYRQVLLDSGAVRNDAVILEKFNNIPPLTKDIIRTKKKDLYAADHNDRKSFVNTSGGSTGASVSFLQDAHYSDWQMGMRFYYNGMAGKITGEPEIKLWGSERDIFMGSEKISTRLRRWLFNIHLLNSFVMSEEDMANYVQRWNGIKPKYVWAYATSIYEFARYVESSGVEIYKPRSIVSTAETLSEEVREFIERVFVCPVYNQYGSREVGVIACQCQEKKGLHMFPLLNIVEVLDDNMNPCLPGQMGDVYVTNLHNYSMPIIRYKIGDTAVAAEQKACSCGRLWPSIESVTGRFSDHFRTRSGKLVHGEYVSHLFYAKDDIKQYRAVQHDYEDVEMLIVPVGTPSEKTLKEITAGMKLVMGENCNVTFTKVKNIPRLASGKYRYTISELTEGGSKDMSDGN